MALRPLAFLRTQSMTRGDLRTSAAVRKRPKCFLERQLDLLGVPPARQPLGDRLTTADLDSKTFEAQGPRAIHDRIVAFVAEPITRFTRAAAGAQHRVGAPLTRFRPCPFPSTSGAAEAVDPD